MDPFNSRYNPKESGNEHSCFGKIKAIQERTGMILTHDEITYICVYLWHTTDAADFYRKMEGLSDEELKKVCEKAKLFKPKLSEHESMLYA